MNVNIKQRVEANTRSESNEFCRQSANAQSFAQKFNKNLKEDKQMTLKEKIEILVLSDTEDINKINEICEEVKSNNYPKELLEDLFKILENNPHFNFGMPGELMRTIEKHYKEPYYYDFVIQSIERYPTEYNLWLLQRLMNTFETDAEKENGIKIFKKILQETKDEGIKEMLEDFMTDYE
jgi:hypothetical protein